MNKTIASIFFILSLFAVIVTSVSAQNQPLCSGSASITDVSQGQPGILGVISNAAKASFTITGPTTYHGSGYFWIQENIPSGTYTITWDAIAGCETPKPETKATNAYGTLSFAGTYKNLNAPAGYGIITIQTNLTKPATFIISGPASKTAQGMGFTWASAPAGTYTVTYGVVEGYDAPRPDTVTLNPNGRINLYASYTITQTKKLDLQHFTIESKPMSGADAYVDDIFVGKTPARATAYFGSRVRIKCSLDGYEDYAGEYRAPDPGSGVIVHNPTTTCFITTKKRPSSPASQSTITPEKQPGEIAAPRHDTETAIPAASTPKPRGLFSRIWNSVLSFFKNIFGHNNANPPSINAGIGSKNTLQGAWSVEQMLMFDPTLNAYRQIAVEKKYIEFKGDKACTDGSYLPTGIPVVCPHYSVFHTEGNKIITEGAPIGQTIFWRLTGDKLELTIEPENETAARSQKIILSKIKNFNPENALK